MKSGFTVMISILVWAFAGSSCNTTEPPDGLADSTSHNVVWRTDLIGVGASSVLDIAIIDRDNIWAVGEFYLLDSTGAPESEMYNLLRWDGTTWHPERLYFTSRGEKYLRGITAVLAFAADDIWVAPGAPNHWDGEGLQAIDYTGADLGTVYGMWGTSSSDFYVIGTPGKLSHCDGKKFTTIPTGVQSRFCDIWGVGNQVFIGSYYYDNQIRPSGVFSYTNGRFRFLFPAESDETDMQALRDDFGLWVSPTGTLWALGAPYVFKPLASRLPIPGINPRNYSLYGIRGNSDADVWVCGTRGIVMHYNGNTWREYDELLAGGYFIDYEAIAAKDDIVVIGGYSISPFGAIVTVGTRLP